MEQKHKTPTELQYYSFPLQQDKSYIMRSTSIETTLTENKQP